MALHCPRRDDTCEAAACSPTYCLLEAHDAPAIAEEVEHAPLSPLGRELVELATTLNSIMRRRG